MSPKISNRSSKVIASPIRKFLPLVKAAEEKGIKVFKLNVGDPDLTPPPALLATIKSYNSPNLGYAPSPGIAEHTKAWVKYYADFGINLAPENIVPTVGGAEAIILALIAVCDFGDEVIVFEPLYTSYKGFAAMCGVKLVPVTLDVNNNFVLPDAAKITEKITEKTKAIVVINPNNPTGTILSANEIKTVCQIAQKRNLFILADETYREIVFAGQPGSFLAEESARENVVVLDSASKRFSCPGARIGCIASFNQDIMWSILKLAMIRLSVPTLEQYGTTPLLNDARPYTEKIRAEYQRRRDAVYSALSKIPGVVCHEPQGAFYLIAKLPVKSSEEFIRWLITDFSWEKKTVLLTPLAEFYVSPDLGVNEVRVAYVLKVEELKEAMAVLARALLEYSSGH